MKSFAERLAEDRRLSILKMLQTAPKYEASEGPITIELNDKDRPCTRDQVRIDFAWLRDAGLVTIDEIADLQFAKLTQPGVETALGIRVTPGVARLDP
jgi:hypothetical protein